MKKLLLLSITISFYFLTRAQVSPQWVQAFGSTTQENDVANKIAMDASGNVIVAGITKHVISSKDSIVLLKYDSSGNLLYQQKHPPFTSDIATISDLKCDSKGNCFLLYNTWLVDATMNAYLEKFDSSGNQLWVSLVSDTGIDETNAQFIMPGAAGNIFIAGYYYTGDSDNLFVQKFNSEGSLIWKNVLYVNSWNTLFYLNDAAIDANENIFLAAVAHDDDVDFSGEGLFAKFDSSGNVQWYHLDYTDRDTRFIYIDSLNQPFTAGYKKQGIDFCDWCIYGWIVNRFDDDGNITWSNSIATTEWLRGLIGDNHHLFVCGVYGNALQYFEMQPDSMAIEAHYCVDSTAITDFNLQSVARDDEGNFYAIGHILSHVRLLVFSSNDSLIAVASFDTLSGAYSSDFVVAKTQRVYCAGAFYNSPGENSDMFTTKFCFEGECENIPTPFPTPASFDSRFTIFPNPFTSSAIIQFFLPKNASIGISLFELEGRKIKAIAEGNFDAGTYQLILEKEHLGSGVYFLQLKTGSQTEMQKIIIQ